MAEMQTGVPFLKAMESVGLGKREGQTVADYSKEIKALDNADRRYFAARIEAEHGIVIAKGTIDRAEGKTTTEGK